jgi:hypothetical protein
MLEEPAFNAPTKRGLRQNRLLLKEVLLLK